MKNLSSIILGLIMSVFIMQEVSATKIISGVVYDNNQQVLVGVSVMEKGTRNGTVTNVEGKYQLEVSDDAKILVFSFIGMQTKEVKINQKLTIDVVMEPDLNSINEITVADDELELEECIVVGYGVQKKSVVTGSVSTCVLPGRVPHYNYQPVPQMQEDYAFVKANQFLDPNNDPLSTFSVDVDRASYSNIRRFLNGGNLPPKDAIRIEEMINYFNYSYDGPKDEKPFAVHHEVVECPWNKSHYLMKVALQGKKIEKENLPPSNIVFLLDVSGSMDSPQKLPLLKSALKMLVNELRDEDKVSIVVYAGAAGVVLVPTSGKEKVKIISALDNLSAGGSTAGGAGLKLAYKLASENFIKDGNNRIVLATDGDFNVGLSSNQEMERLIESERDKGIYITVAGFGMGNYKDSKMEIIADKGNGNYFYIDNFLEAKKALVEEFGGTLFTIAKDVKLQLEFNPQHVAGYRLIGYENRLLNKEDFNNDKVDAGEIGAGHTVTALYEIIPVGAKDVGSYLPTTDPLKYQKEKQRKQITAPKDYSDELLTVKLRYKLPSQNNSSLMVVPIKNKVINITNASSDFKVAASVAAWGMKLKNENYVNNTSIKDIVEWAENSDYNDKMGYFSEMIRLMKISEMLFDDPINTSQ
ncbi:vWA domain-containing protein [Plebeiibacterium sediminum]|uniref:von Willebrand factor type A domain-containing protein n=1 Tax=Plebeiibacterium sediminum TaxID=2992112 RepID=A0AAE3SFK5_9BACT|nr:von Willebrand factor type A domain-containing protein [Plebeiobacterium sediminum]MCW3787187.1 von Willebrand factor type A domain-containing protein [Plebeiobacterium sediminum]